MSYALGTMTSSLWALHKDALSMACDGILWYSPPISLVSRVLAMIERKNCKILVIVLFWPRQSWFTRDVRLLVRP